MRIGFNASAINERGMSVALYDYAVGAQDVLGHESVVFFNEAKSNPQVVEKFRQKLKMVPTDGATDLRAAADPHKLDAYYVINSGRGVVPRVAPRTCAHAVFRHFAPHGDVYAYVSRWLADWMTGGAAPHVPHIVELPEPRGTFRSELGLPSDAFVVGRYGGLDQFNIPFAKRSVADALSARSNLHFLFVNTEKFIDHPRTHFLPARVTPQEKADFIEACDVGLNAKKIGESFGLATAEFMALGKPTFSWAGGMDQNHVAMTPSSEWLYKTRRDLTRLLAGYQPSDRDADLARAAVADYAPAKVMKQFEQVFLTGPSNASNLKLGPVFKAKRYVQQKALRAKFRIWKMV